MAMTRIPNPIPNGKPTAKAVDDSGRCFAEKRKQDSKSKVHKIPKITSTTHSPIIPRTKCPPFPTSPRLVTFAGFRNDHRQVVGHALEELFNR